MSCLRKNILLEVIKIPRFIFKCATEQITHFNSFLFRFVCFYPLSVKYTDTSKCDLLGRLSFVYVTTESYII